MTPYETYTIDLQGMTFRVEYHYDEDMCEPWKEHDGHGVVSEWTTRDKRPGERVLVEDCSSKRYYDIAASVKIAKREGWDCEERCKMVEVNPTRKWTKNEIAAHAVKADFAHMKAWCDDEWHWAGVVVTLLNVDGEDTNETESLWGMESSDDEGLKSTGVELAEEIASRIPASGELCVRVKAIA